MFASIKLWKRLFVIGTLIIIPIIVLAYQDSQLLYEEKDTANQQQSIAQSNLSKSKNKKDEIPKLEVTLSDIELKIKHSDDRYPIISDSFIMTNAF